MTNNFLKFMTTKGKDFVTKFKTFEPTLVKSDSYPKAWYIVDGSEKLQLNHDETFEQINQKLSNVFKNEEVAKKDWSKIPKNKYVKIVLTNGTVLFGTLTQLRDCLVTETRYSNVTGFLQTIEKHLDNTKIEFYKQVFSVAVPSYKKVYKLNNDTGNFEVYTKYFDNGINKIVSIDNTDDYLCITKNNDVPNDNELDNIIELFELTETIYVYKVFQ